MTRFRAMWRRLFPPSDGTVCGLARLTRCEAHRVMAWPCRCLEPKWHGGGHECGQGARRGGDVRSAT